MTQTKTKHNKRWQLLRNALLSQAGNQPQTHPDQSECVFKALFGRVESETVSSLPETDMAAVHTLLYPLGSGYQLKISTPQHRIDKANLFSQYSGFLNTGNVRIWNSEHVMAYWAAIKNPELFRGKSVLELGSGMTGLAGLAIASAANPASVHVTDGNPTSVASLQSNIARNLSCFGPSAVVNASQLLWGEKSSTLVDVIVGGDCTFDANAHEPLMNTIIACLNVSGVAYLFCPRRGNSLLQFYQLCHSKSDGLLQVQWIENYDEDVWAIHAEQLELSKNDPSIYNADKEYPIMIKISRLPKLE
ncbi:hypothetical protein HDU78_007467 [Chytriomyces hyalinus]|nr:hypothetical protein HDU78_007467 [Chytriomyces hyalinus]